jgi:hypothetical protein
MKELAALAYHNSINDNREFWKNEMGQALREIQQVYDEKMDSVRGELETFYNLKVYISFYYQSLVCLLNKIIIITVWKLKVLIYLSDCVWQVHLCLQLVAS